MRIAISAMGEGWDQLVDPRFGRAAGFVIIDTMSDTTSYLDNQANLEAGIKVFGGVENASIQEAYEKFLAGALKE